MGFAKILPNHDLLRVRTLARGLESGNDNFLLLRLIAASLVVYSHGMAFARTLGGPDVLAWMGAGDAGALAVDVFFVASGFMIAGSYLRRRHLLDFLWARLLRIYPAYLLCLLGCAYVLGAIYTTLPLAAYLGQHEVTHYVSKNMQLSPGMVWTLPGVFTHNPKMDVVNGAIWTLPAEVRMYLWVALLGGLGILARRRWCNLAIAALLAWGLFGPVPVPMVPIEAYRHLAAYFALGVLCYVNRERVPVGWPLVIALAGLAWLLHATPVYAFAFGLALASFVFAFAYATPWHGFNRFGDYSYGLYLWGFPLQQVVAYHLPQAGPLQNAVLGWLAAMALAVLSWHAIEKPCLQLKSLPRALLDRARLQPDRPAA
jgi:peptidoglycan/LPS O-acetylase OafA/YrhL